jgi:hypothetical protein
MIEMIETVTTVGANQATIETSIEIKATIVSTIEGGTIEASLVVVIFKVVMMTTTRR